MKKQTREVKVYGFGVIWNGIFQYRGKREASVFMEVLGKSGHTVEKLETLDLYVVSNKEGKVVGQYEWA